jgi:hypothetical protein
MLVTATDVDVISPFENLSNLPNDSCGGLMLQPTDAQNKIREPQSRLKDREVR